VQRVDGYYLYQVGHQIHPLSELRHQDTRTGKATNLEEARFPLYIAESALDTLLARSVFRLKTSVQSGNFLLAAIRGLKVKLEAAPDTQAIIDWWDMYSVTSALTCGFRRSRPGITG